MTKRPIHNISGISFRDKNEKREVNSSLWLQVYDRDLVVKRPSFQKVVSRGDRTKIFGFSKSSQRNLLTTCRNSGHYIKSQFTLTYSDVFPTDGLVVKNHLHMFLKRVRRKFGKDIRFVWCLEFQKRGAPHFHWFSDLLPTTENRLFLASAWVEVIGAGAECLAVHSHPNQFISWDMRSGAYLAKEYIGKKEQKDVPEEFHNVGRFWGCSRNMKPRHSTIFLDLQDETTKASVLRNLGLVSRHHENKVCGIKRRVQAARRFKAECEKRAFQSRPVQRVNLRNKRKTVNLHLCAGLFMALLSVVPAPGGFSRLSSYEEKIVVSPDALSLAFAPASPSSSLGRRLAVSPNITFV